MRQNQQGQSLILALIALTVIILGVLTLISSSYTVKQNSRYTLDTLDAANLAEAGIDKAVATLNSTGGSYNGESETQLGSGSYSVTVTSQSPTTIQIQSTGYIPNKTNPKVKRTVKMQVSKGVGISFVYGMLVGNGGVSMGNDSNINGSLYTNGNLRGGNNENITGDVFVAGGTQPTAEQQADCSGVNCDSTGFIFGKTVSGNDQIDAAQSFKPSSTGVINKVSLKLKKIGLPSNITVRLLGDTSGKPNKNSVLASGILSANLVSSQFSFIDMTFSTNPILTANTPYWIVLDASSNSSNYWSWSLDSLGSYTGGSPAWSPDWQAHDPVWTTINGDLGFKTWMGGVTTSISMGNGSVVGGNVYANTIQGVTINKDAHYQTIADSIVRGVSYPNSTDPAPVAMPISEANITEWQTDAENRGINTGNITGCPGSLGPGKIIGSVTISNNCTVTVTTPIWITGNLSTGNSVVLKMDSGLGSTSGVIIVDGTTTFSNGDDLLGTGVAGSYLTLLSTYNSQTNGIIAINTNNSSITGILYSPFGIISLANNAKFKEAVAWQIIMGTGSLLTYDSGLISTFFSAGPGGSYSAVKGTYQSE